MIAGIAIGIGIVIGLAIAPTLIRWVVWFALISVVLGRLLMIVLLPCLV
jgi:hypothetical protein